MIEIIEKPQDSKRKELEEKIRIYKKNNKALCDMLVLCLYIFQNDSPDVIFYQIAETFLKDLEDPEVRIEVNSPNISKMFENDEDEYNSIYDELKENNFDDLIDKLKLDRKRINDLYYVYFWDYENRLNRKFDFINLLFEHSRDWTSEFLISDIDIKTRIEFLYQIILRLSITKDRTFNVGILNYLLARNGAGYKFSRTAEKVKKEKIDELILNFNKEISIANKKEIFLNITKNIENTENHLDFIVYLQKNGIIDFTDLKGSFELDGHKVNSSCCIYFLKHRVDTFQKFYELKDYLKISPEIRKNDDIYLLKNINIYHMSKFISLSNFEITEEKIGLISRILLEILKEEEDSLKGVKLIGPRIEILSEIKKKILPEIENAIIHKAKNKEEYKKMCKYIGIIREAISNYEKQKIEELTEIQELEDKRKEFVGVIKNLSENLMETAPARKKIRDINFSE